MSSTPLHLIADAFSGIAFVADKVGQLQHLSPRFYEFTGLDPESPAAEVMRSAIHPIDRARVVARWEASVEAAAPFRSIFRLRRRDGRSRWFWALGRLVGAGTEEAAQWIGVCLFMDDLGPLQMVTGPEAGGIIWPPDPFAPNLDLSAWAVQDRRTPAVVTRDIREKLTAAATFAIASARLLQSGGVDARDRATELLGRISDEMVAAGRLIHDFGDGPPAAAGRRSGLDG
jgi:PAS domain S-box-containing protein